MTTPTTQREADERAEFEAWAKKEDFWPVERFGRDHDGAYLDDEVHAYFVAFKAGLARAAIDRSTRQAAPEAPTAWTHKPDPCDGCEGLCVDCPYDIERNAPAAPAAATDQPSAGSGQRSTGAES